MRIDIHKAELVALDNPLRWFLWATLGMFAVRPAIEHLALTHVFEIALVFIFVAIIRQLSPSRVLFGVSVALLLATGVVRFLAESSRTPWMGTLSHLLPALLVATVILLLISFVVRSKVITQNTVLAAISIYVFMGVFWGFAYLLLYDSDPSCFTLDPQYGAPEQQLRYYSLITLTTVGYGDVVPKSPQARAFSALEALVGQIYMAAIVARLVGIEITMSMNKKVEREVEQRLEERRDPTIDHGRS